MPIQTYDFTNAAEYDLQDTEIVGAELRLVAGATQGSALGEVFFKGALITSVAANQSLNGGQILYGLELDTILHWHNGSTWVPSNGTSAELNTIAQLQTFASSALDLSRPLVRPYMLLTRTVATDPTPAIQDISFAYEEVTPNYQVIQADDALRVALDTGVGGIASPGETRVTTDPNEIIWTPGANDLFVFRNGVHQKVGVDYIEEDSIHIVFTYLLDAVPPYIDSIELRSAAQGSSLYLPAPECLKQADPPERPDNFGGIFSFD